MVVAQKCDSKPVIRTLFYLAETIPNKCQSAAACPISMTIATHLTSTTTVHVLLVTPATPCYIPPYCQAHSSHFLLVQLCVCVPFTVSASCLLIIYFTTIHFAFICFAFVHFHSYSCYCTSTCYSIVTYMYIGHYQHWDPHSFLFGFSARDTAEPSLLL